MNKSWTETLYNFLCCRRKKIIRHGDHFKDEEFSIDTEVSQLEAIDTLDELSPTAEEVSQKSGSKVGQNTEPQKEKKVTIVDPKSAGSNSTLESSGKKENVAPENKKIKNYVLNKLKMSEKQLEDQKRRQALKKLAKIDSMPNGMVTEEEIESILSSVTSLYESEEKPKEESDEAAKIKKIERVLETLQSNMSISKTTNEIEEPEKNITKISTKGKKTRNNTNVKGVSITNDTNSSLNSSSNSLSTAPVEKSPEAKSLRDQRIYNTSLSASNSSLSLDQFVKTVDDSEDSDSSGDDSEITCFIKNYDDKTHSKSLAKKMERALKKNKK